MSQSEDRDEDKQAYEPEDVWEKSPEELVIDQENTRLLEETIEQELTPLEKQVMDLHLTGMGYREIAKVLGRDGKSTDNALQRSRGKLRRALDKKTEQEKEVLRPSKGRGISTYDGKSVFAGSGGFLSQTLSCVLDRTA